MKKFLKWFIPLLLVACIGVGCWYFTNLKKYEDVWLDENGEIMKNPNGDPYPMYTGEPGATNVSKNEKTGEDVYKVSGVWVWHETPGTAEFGLLNVEFDSYGKTYCAIRGDSWHEGLPNMEYISFNKKTYLRSAIVILESDFDDYRASDPAPSYDWEAMAYRLMDFGEKPQTVSKAFYDYLINNADPADKTDFDEVIKAQIEDDKVYQISGLWEWNETLEHPDNLKRRIDVDVPFRAFGVEFVGFHITEDISRFGHGSLGNVTYTNVDLESPDGYSGYGKRFPANSLVGEEFRAECKLDFGPEPVNISSAGYHYLMRNATRIGDGTVGLEEVKYVEISGEWEWKETLSSSSVMLTLEDGKFSSGGTTYSGIEVLGTTLCYTRISPESGGEETLLIYSTSSDWWRPECRRIDFGRTPVQIDERLFQYIKENATQTSEQGSFVEQRGVLVSGMWQWKDYPTPPETKMTFVGISFSSDGRQCDSIELNTDGTITYFFDDNGDKLGVWARVINQETGNLMYFNSLRRLISFEGACEIPVEFYNYLLRNAHQLVK